MNIVTYGFGDSVYALVGYGFWGTGITQDIPFIDIEFSSNIYRQTSFDSNISRNINFVGNLS